jgi:hypothetical protein
MVTPPATPRSAGAIPTVTTPMAARPARYRVFSHHPTMARGYGPDASGQARVNVTCVTPLDEDVASIW